MSERRLGFEAVMGLRKVPMDLVRRLVSDYGSALRDVGLDPEALDAEGLWAARARLPGALVDRLHRIQDLSDDVGRDALTEIVDAPLPAPPEWAAMVACLDHPEAFHRALRRRFDETSVRYRMFAGRLPLRPAPSEEAFAAAEARFSDYFARRRAGRCRIRRWEEPDGLHFRVESGGSGEGSARPPRWDPVHYDPRTGRLAADAADAATLYEYVAGFGALLFGDPGWFTDGDVVSLAPLLEAPDDVCRPSSGVLAVRVTEIEFVCRSEGLGSFVVRGDDVLRGLDVGSVDVAGHGLPRRAVFRLLLQHDRAWRTVAVGAPDRLAGDWRDERGVVRRYLEERGFLAGPPIEAVSEVA